MEAVGEIFSSIQGEGLLVGRRQVFVRFSGCPLRCVYCDTKEFWVSSPFCRVETSPGSGRFRVRRNPLPAAEITKEILKLVTPDTHSISITGGEPLSSPNLLHSLLKRLKEEEKKIYLETAGTDPSLLSKVSSMLDYASIDIKLPDHEAVPRKKWKFLFERELLSIETAKRENVDVFAKIVILRDSTIPSRVYHILGKLEVPLVLQPVTPTRGVEKPTPFKLLKLAERAAREGVETAIIPQIHKFLGVK